MTDCRIAFTARERAELVAMPAPADELQADGVVVKTLATLVSAGTELNMQYSGDRFPAHPGYAAVGRVERLGTSVEDLAVGDVIFSMGQHASRLWLKRKDVVKLPGGLDPCVATFARLMGVSMATLSTTRARPPASVLVTGLGPVGHLAAQIFQGSGYRVTGVDPDQRRREWAASVGIEAKERVGDVGEYALAVECSGHEQAALDACQAVARGAEVALVGVPWKKRTELSAHAVFHAVFHRYVHLRSGWEWGIPFEAPSFVGPSTLGNFSGALRFLQEGRVKVDGLYERCSPTDAQRVYQGLLRQAGEHLAFVFDWTRL